ncbi:hypothetical protein A9P82_12825 [Arachidicoccus ginsenosidimutans]|nr:hypothetical protein A9P82_12825 [Arachidicoccus sp. BS20]
MHTVKAQQAAVVALRVVCKPVQGLTFDDSKQLQAKLDNYASNNNTGIGGVADKKHLSIYSAGAFVVKASASVADSLSNCRDSAARGTIVLNTSLSEEKRRTGFLWHDVNFRKAVKLKMQHGVSKDKVIVSSAGGTVSSFDVLYDDSAHNEENRQQAQPPKEQHTAILYTMEPN